MENSYKYFFTLSKTSNLTNSHAGFLQSPDFAISFIDEDHSGSEYIFTSFHLNHTNDVDSVWSKGTSLLALYNGACRVFGFNPTPNEDEVSIYSQVEFTSLYLCDERASLFNDGRHTEITPREKEDLIQLYPFDDTIDFLSKRRLNPLISPITHSIFLAKSNPDVYSILLLAGNNLDWISLYSILDTLKHYTKDFDSLTIISGHTKDKLKAFTGTANNYGLLGINARHGEQGWTSPKNTINLKESQKLILDLCIAYFTSKYKVKL